jgi:hypothetical protein
LTSTLPRDTSAGWNNAVQKTEPLVFFAPVVALNAQQADGSFCDSAAVAAYDRQSCQPTRKFFVTGF